MDSTYADQKILDADLDREVKRSFLEYSMSVIISRALPDVRDGLKPVHRRILYAMFEDRLTHDKPFCKSATTVGNVLGRYHPHGDTAVYDAMVRLAQSFSLRYPLIEGHGNFGNVDGDGAAAYRYTEARLARLADSMMTDIEKDVVDYDPNYDSKLKEPRVLPSRFPNLLVNGSVGIAVGMATYIPPHNLGEVIDGAIALIDNPAITIPQLMEYIKGPDFPTYATIHGVRGITEGYLTGRGRVMVRAKAAIEEHKNTHRIVITEIPYQVNKSSLVVSIADLVKDKRVEGITEIRDESGRAGMRIVIELRRDANPQVVLNLLYKFTQMQDTCAMNMIALVNGEPKMLNLKQMLMHYVKHQLDVETRRIKFDLEKARKRAHILEGLKIAIDNIDEIIALIRSCRSIPEAKQKLIDARFGFSDLQAQAIVEMPLGRLAGLEIEKIIEELNALHTFIEELLELLADEGKVYELIKSDMLEIKRRFSDDRRTEIQPYADEIMIEDLIEREMCAVTLTHAGYIKRLPADTYQTQRRGGRGITGMATKEEDFVKEIYVAGSHDFLLFFSNRGRVYIKKTYELPEAGRTAKGTNIVNILSLEQGETITAMIPVSAFDKDIESEYLTMLTKKGIIKRTALSEFENRMKKGKIAITLDEDDELLYVRHTNGTDQLLIATAGGLALRIYERAVRAMGRNARGVRGIRLDEGDYTVGMEIVDRELTKSLPVPTGDEADTEAEVAEAGEELSCPIDDVDDEGEEVIEGEAAVPTRGQAIVTITENGFGKRCDFERFTPHGRGCKGMTCHKINDKTGKLAGIAAVNEDEELMLITDNGTIIRTPVSQIPVYGRSSSGVIVMRMYDGAKIISFAKVNREEEDEDECEEKEQDGE